MIKQFLLGLCIALCVVTLAAAKDYAQITVIDGPYDDPKTIYYSGGQATPSSFQRGYDAGFDDGYSTGYVRGVEHGRNSPYNRYYDDCDNIDDWDDWEDCYVFHPGVYPTYPVYSYPAHYAQPSHSQYYYLAEYCRKHHYSRYC